jgi:hypothetical protein
VGPVEWQAPQFNNICDNYTDNYENGEKASTIRCTSSQISMKLLDIMRAVMHGGMFRI